MSNPFFDHPILNSPYSCPQRHWELDNQGQPTQQILESRRRADFVTPIPKPKKRKGKKSAQQDLVFDEGLGLSTQEQQYDLTSIINEVRGLVDRWRALNPSEWQVTPETSRLLQHWRNHKFADIRPFFCQIEAVETAIWLTEVAPHSKAGKRLLDHLASANRDANPQLMRLALKLATGAGKTTVMAMLIAWQTINAVRRPGSKNFTRGFLVVTPGLTIKDRLRVLQPNDPDSYYKDRELVPADMLEEMSRAKIVIANYHAFKLRERVDLSKGGRQLLQGRLGDELNTLETEGQMLQRVMPDLMGIPVLKARMNADLHMADDLKNTGKGNLFVIFGEPDVGIFEGASPELRDETKRIQQRQVALDKELADLTSVRNEVATKRGKLKRTGKAVESVSSEIDEATMFARLAERFTGGVSSPFEFAVVG